MKNVSVVVGRGPTQNTFVAMLELVRVRTLFKLSLQVDNQLSCGVAIERGNRVAFGTTGGLILLVDVNDGAIDQCYVGGPVKEIGVIRAGEKIIIVARVDSCGIVALLVAGRQLKLLKGFGKNIEDAVGEPVRLMCCATHVADVDVWDELDTGVLVVVSGRTVSLVTLRKGGQVAVAGKLAFPETPRSLGFCGKTIVVSARKRHYFVRVGRDESLAVVSSVRRAEPAGAKAIEEGRPAIFGALQGLFGQRPTVKASRPSPVAVPLGDERWLINGEFGMELYSSYGRRLHDSEWDTSLAHSMDHLDSSGGLTRSLSLLSLSSVRTEFTDDSVVIDRRPPLDVAMVPPLLIGLLPNQELIVFSTNETSAPLQVLKLDERFKNMRLISFAGNGAVAVGFQQNGEVSIIELTRSLESFVDDLEREGELAKILDLLRPRDKGRKSAILRLIAKERRSLKHHEEAVKFFERSMLIGDCSKETLGEAIQLRDQDHDDSWRRDGEEAKIYANFLWRIRRRLNEPSHFDNAVLESLCATDTTAGRIKLLLSGLHGVSEERGVKEISSPDCTLSREERIPALVALFHSLHEHSKVLDLWEQERGNDAVEDICDYLKAEVGQVKEETEFFKHIEWILQTSHEYKDLVVDVILATLPEVFPPRSHIQRTLFFLCERIPEGLEGYADQLVALYGSRTDEKSPQQVGFGAQLLSVNDLSIPDDRKAFWSGILKSWIAVLLTFGNSPETGLFESLRLVFDKLLYHRTAKYDPKEIFNLIGPDLGLTVERAYLCAIAGDYEGTAGAIIEHKHNMPAETLRQVLKLLPHHYEDVIVSHTLAAFLKEPAWSDTKRSTACSALVTKYGSSIDLAQILENLDLREGRCPTISDIQDSAATALSHASEEAKKSRMLYAFLKGEHQMIRESLFERRRSRVVVGTDDTCRVCTRRMQPFNFNVYRDGSFAHLACSRSNQDHKP